MMEPKRTATLLSVLLLSGVLLHVQAATPRVIAANKTVSCAGESVSGQINYSGTETTGSYKNTAPIIDMRSGATLQVTNSQQICVGLIVTNGPATVYMKNGTLPPRFWRHVIVRSPGVLTIKNRSAATFGKVDDYGLAGSYCHFYEVRNIKFANSSGKQQNGTVTFCHARVLAFPDAANGVTWEADSNRDPCLWLAGTSNMFADAGTVVSKDYGRRLIVETPEAIQYPTTVTISEGCSFGVLPAATFDTSVQHFVDTALNRIGDDDLTGATSFAFTPNITFESSESVLSNDFAWASALSFSGKITGAGAACTHVRGGDYAAGKVTTHSFANTKFFTGSWEFSASDDLALSGPVCQIAAEATPISTFTNATIIVGSGGGIVGKPGVNAVCADKVIGRDARSAYLQVQSSQTMSILRASGAFAVRGADKGSSVLNIVKCDGPTVVGDNGSAMIRFNSQLPTVGARAPAYDGSFTCYAFPDSSGFVDIAALRSAMADYPYLGIYASDGSVLKGVGDAATTLMTESDANVAVASDGGVDVVVRGDGSVALQDSTAQSGSWTNAVTCWFDFNNVDSYRRLSALSTMDDELLKATLRWKATGTSSYKQYPLICAVVDWRYPESKNRLWNGYWELSSRTAADRKAYTNEVSPIYMEKTYRRTMTVMAVPSGQKRRLPFCTGDTPAMGGNPTVFKEIIMVFGSQDGGGDALVATTESAFGRQNGKSYSFMTNNAYGVTLRVNGEAVDPTTEKPDGSYQVLTIGMNDLHFKGLGYLNSETSSANGGQRYGDVLLFENELDEVSRLEAEMYLADKWHITYPNREEALARIEALRWASVTNRVTASGSGTIVGAGRTLEVYGDFTGTIKLDGDKMHIAGRTLAYTAEQIPSENRFWWSDPSDTNTLKIVTYGSMSNAVRAVADRVGGYTIGKPFLLGVAKYTPYLVEGAHGFGPKLPWLDFYEYADPTHTTTETGNDLRFNQLTKGYDFAKGSDVTRAREKFPIHTAFFVQDFSRGGYGNALLDSLSGTYLKVRDGGRTDPIWKGSLKQFSQGVTRLNGRVVDQADGVTGLPELLTLRATEPYKSTGWFVGAAATSYQQPYGEMFGEIIVYTNALSDADVIGIEGYLMKKWLGTVPPGIADLSQATISGRGELTVADGSLLPNMSSDFSGSLTVNGSSLTLDVRIDPETDVVTGAMNVPDATLTLPASCTLNVDFSGKLLGSIDERRYALVNFTKSNVPAENWVINLGPQVPSVWAHIERTGNLIELVVDPAGFMIMVK